MSKKNQEAQKQPCNMHGVSKRAFVNIYEDEEGRFISDKEYDSFKSAFENRDDLSIYRETVEIVRHVC